MTWFLIAVLVIVVEALIRIARGLPQGTSEIGCHPGLRRDAGGMYVVERELEVRTLCDPRVREALGEEGIELTSFHPLNNDARSVRE